MRVGKKCAPKAQSENPTLKHTHANTEIETNKQEKKEHFEQLVKVHDSCASERRKKQKKKKKIL